MTRNSARWSSAKRQRMVEAGAPGDAVVFGYQAPLWLMVLATVISVAMPLVRARGLVARPGRIQIWQLDMLGFKPIKFLRQVDAPEIILEKRTKNYDKLRIGDSVVIVPQQSDDVDRLIRISRQPPTEDVWRPGTGVVPQSRISADRTRRVLNLGILITLGAVIMVALLFVIFT